MQQRAIYETAEKQNIMDRDFERFRGGPNEALQDRLYVTLSPARNFVLNRNTYEQLGSPAAVRLYYSHKRDSIGIETASGNFNEAFPVVPNGASGWRICAAPFCRHFNLSVETTMKFLTPVIVGTTMTLNLVETISVARPKRRQNPSAT